MFQGNQREKPFFNKSLHEYELPIKNITRTGVLPRFAAEYVKFSIPPQPEIFERFKLGYKDKDELVSLQIEVTEQDNIVTWNLLENFSRLIEGRFFYSQDPNDYIQQAGKVTISLDKGENDANWSITIKKYKIKKYPNGDRVETPINIDLQTLYTLFYDVIEPDIFKLYGPNLKKDLDKIFDSSFFEFKNKLREMNENFFNRNDLKDEVFFMEYMLGISLENDDICAFLTTTESSSDDPYTAYFDKGQIFIDANMKEKLEERQSIFNRSSSSDYKVVIHRSLETNGEKLQGLEFPAAQDLLNGYSMYLEKNSQPILERANKTTLGSQLTR